MARQSELGTVALMVTIPAVVMIAVCLIFGAEINYFFGNVLFAAVFIISLAGFVWNSYVSFKKQDDPNSQKNRWGALIFAALFVVWVGTWSAQNREDVKDGIRQGPSK